MKAAACFDTGKDRVSVLSWGVDDRTLTAASYEGSLVKYSLTKRCMIHEATQRNLVYTSLVEDGTHMLATVIRSLPALESGLAGLSGLSRLCLFWDDTHVLVTAIRAP